MRNMLLIAASLGVAAATSAGAATVAVGTCDPNVPTYPTIGQAVAGVSAGSTIEVCPGLYPEQVTITQSLTLMGVNQGGSSLARLTVPTGGFVANAYDFDHGLPTAAQILISGGTKVTVSGLLVDGSGSTFQDCSTGLVGILVQNASAIIGGNSVLNTTLGAGLQGCQTGIGILAQANSGTNKVTITGNHIAGFDKDGISVRDPQLTATITGNTVTGAGPTGVVAQNGIELVSAAGGTLSGNVVGNFIYTGGDYAATSVLLADTPNVTVKTNTISRTQYAVIDYASGSTPVTGGTVTGNVIGHAQDVDAVDFCGVNGATATKNVISGAFVSGIHLDGTCNVATTGASVSGNTVNYACAAILQGTGQGGTIGKNVYHNTANDVLAADTCGSGQARAGRRMPSR